MCSPPQDEVAARINKEKSLHCVNILCIIVIHSYLTPHLNYIKGKENWHETSHEDHCFIYHFLFCVSHAYTIPVNRMITNFGNYLRGILWKNKCLCHFFLGVLVMPETIQLVKTYSTCKITTSSDILLGISWRQ